LAGLAGFAAAADRAAGVFLVVLDLASAGLRAADPVVSFAAVLPVFAFAAALAVFSLAVFSLAAAFAVVRAAALPGGWTSLRVAPVASGTATGARGEAGSGTTGASVASRRSASDASSFFRLARKAVLLSLSSVDDVVINVLPIVAEPR
jgi:hypothetical protein